MINKIFLFLCIGFAGVSYAQTYSSSPFSSKGIGEAGGLEDPQFGAIGNCRAALMDSGIVNIFNPASYAALSKGQPLFSVGMSSRLSNYSQNGITSQGRVVGLNQITMVIPFAKHFGLAGGLQPFSRKGYSITQYEQVNTDSIQYVYDGSGSTQQVFLGFSWRFIHNKKHELSAGVNGSYIFGAVTDERTSELTSNSPVGGVDTKTYRVNSGFVSFGASYVMKFDGTGNRRLTIGAVFTPQQQLNATREYGLFYAHSIGTPSTYDTLYYNKGPHGKITNPGSLTLGFNFAIRPVNSLTHAVKNIYQLNIYGDFTSTMTQNYSTNFSDEQERNVFVNSNRTSLGAQFTPNYDSKASEAKYLYRIRYRAGAYYANLPYVENGKQLTEKAVTIGVGLPVASQKTNSSFNFSVQYGKRGNAVPAGLKETFISVNFGVILAPAGYDKWFKRYKVD